MTCLAQASKACFGSFKTTPEVRMCAECCKYLDFVRQNEYVDKPQRPLVTDGFNWMNPGRK